MESKSAEITLLQYYLLKHILTNICNQLPLIIILAVIK